MKNWKKIASLALAVAVVVGIVAGHKADASPSTFTITSSATYGPVNQTPYPGVQIVSTGNSGLFGTYATTTQSYMTPGTATTTFTIVGFAGNNAGADSEYLFINFTASTTAATLAWKEQFSNNNIDWYDEDIAAIPGTTGLNQIMHASSTVFHSWQPGNATASTTGKALQLDQISAYYKRILFWLPIGSTNGSVWVQSASKNNATGQ